MKIWIAELVLIYENKWEAVFCFESNDREYELNEKINSYTYGKGWVYDRVPVNMRIDKTWTGNLKVHQGFDRELSEEELREVESKMKILLLKELEEEKNEYLKTYENKIEALRKTYRPMMISEA